MSHTIVLASKKGYENTHKIQETVDSNLDNYIKFKVAAMIPDEIYLQIEEQINQSNKDNQRLDQHIDKRVDIDLSRFASLTLRRSDTAHIR
ncbi:hypothetical protein TSUD_364860 [Trifolium subterraneum]|uniref:Uncharacterized protein n=1 Tax=Trifolium subterraneum TaxID=3900 RepID=A0A2Z6MPQ3_TRISU|nr:hypothetical protein TSUD_364860 [Trifolium subterraneum]